MKPFVVLLTGMSGSGKSTLARRLESIIIDSGIPLQVVDGDELRQQLGNLFGYSREERMKNSRVVRVLAKYLKDNKINTILAIVAPYEEMRKEFREYIGEGYYEIYVKCSYETCSNRDVKGYYRKQKLGLISNLNGADDIFEEPAFCDLVVDTEKQTIDMCVSQIYAFLEEKNGI